MGRKRKCVVSGGGVGGSGGAVEREEPRNAANERERDRMRVLSAAFVQLKKSLPWVPSDTKLSKLDTLLMATRYIRYLRQLLVEDLQATLIADAETHPVNLVSWLLCDGILYLYCVDAITQFI